MVFRSLSLPPCHYASQCHLHTGSPHRGQTEGRIHRHCLSKLAVTLERSWLARPRAQRSSLGLHRSQPPSLFLAVNGRQSPFIGLLFLLQYLQVEKDRLVSVVVVVAFVFLRVWACLSVSRHTCCKKGQPTFIAVLDGNDGVCIPDDSPKIVASCSPSTECGLLGLETCALSMLLHWLGLSCVHHEKTWTRLSFHCLTEQSWSQQVSEDFL